MAVSDNNKTSYVTVYIDNVPYQVSSENNLLAGVLSQKLNLPYFCWHPSMGSVGACRQCAVTQYQDEEDTRGRMVMACTTPVTDGMRIGLNDESSAHFREQVIGAMMTNHPHDCPVCAEGGECHLQDMTVMTGHSQREYQGSKRTFTNQYLGEFVGHEMNRCITCYRCTRFYNDYAGGKDFGVYGSKNQVYFGRANDGALESEFSGNLVEVCPTGVFTNKLFSSHYTRKWDLQSSPSVCAHCSIGCNTSIGERYGTVRRVVNRYNKDINGYFLCDRGRFGIGFVNGEKRIRQARGIKQQSPIHLSQLDVAKTLSPLRGKTFIGVGSARASLEANAYLQHIVGKNNFSVGFSAQSMALASLHKTLLSQYLPPTLEQVEQSDFIFVIGEDITQTAPRMALSIRQALRNASIEKAASIGIPSWQDSAVRTIGGRALSPLYSLQSHDTKLDDVCEQSLWQSPQEMAEFVEQLTQLVRINLSGETPNLHEFSLEKQPFIKSFLSAFMAAKNPLVISGWSAKSPELLSAISALMEVLTDARLAILPEQSNSVGVLSLLNTETLSTEQVFTLLEDSLEKEQGVTGVILLEQEWRDLNEGQKLLLSSPSVTVIVLDHTESQLSHIADIVMPVAAVSEADGHFVNYQGRCQRFYQTHPPVLPVQDSWRWLGLLEDTIFTPVSASLSKKGFSQLAELNDYLHQLDDSWPITPLAFKQCEQVARQTHRASGRTSLMANISVHEVKNTQTRDSSFRFSMEGQKASNSADMPFTWAPGWNSNQSISQFQQEVGGELAKAAPPIIVSFNKSEALIALWCVNSLVKQTANPKENLLQFINKPSLYLSDWQASKNPEFQLTHQHNTLHVPKAWAEQRQWQNGGVVHVEFEQENGEFKQIKEGEHHHIALLVLDENLPLSLSYGTFIDDIGVSSHTNINVSEASEQLVTLYQHMLTTRQQQAKSEKEKILARLKENDQTIPIRLMSGGLDDA